MGVIYNVAMESDEQQALFRWAAYNRGKWPELEMMYHIPNEGRRSAREGARMKREGLRAGVPDICLPVPRGAYHGMYVELKRTRGGTVSAAQDEWLHRLTRQGYVAVCCKGWEAAARAIEDYLEGRMQANDDDEADGGANRAER